MKIIKYIILGLFLLNLPGIANVGVSSALGGILSYASFLLLIIYYIIFLRGKPNFWLFYVGFLYFLISGVQLYINYPFGKYVVYLLKFLILVICGNSFFKTVTTKDVAAALLLGGLSLVFNVLFFADDYGRYSGFYLNPNAAGYVCATGYALSFALENKKARLLLQVVFTICGLLTFSRTYMLVWVIINLLSLRISFKNIRVLVFGLGLGIALLIFGELFNLGGARFAQFQSLLDNKSSSELQEGSRTETWALFYDAAVSHPFFGGGFGEFHGGGLHSLGPHNTYLLIFGESGIIPLLLFLAFILYLLFWSNRLFKLNPSLFLTTITLAVYLLTTHNYFDNYFKLCITLFLFSQIERFKPVYFQNRFS